jgi:hypothetical protein
MQKKTRAVNLFHETHAVYMGMPYNFQDPRDIRVGDPGFLGNPFTEGTEEENLLRFKNYFLQRVKEDLSFRQSVLSVYGQNLGCVCSLIHEENHECHANFVAEWINSHYNEYCELLDPELEGSHLKKNHS